MGYQSLVGRVARRLPKGRGRIARWLQRHPGTDPIVFVDRLGYRGIADLRDDIECQWFAGVDLGLPRRVVARLGAGDWVIDIGANIGVVTRQLAKRVGVSGCVWAIEPVPRNSARIRQLIDGNGLEMIRTFDLAVGDRDGSVALRLPADGGSGWASVTASWIDAGVIDVPVRSLDSLVTEFGDASRALTLIKIDVEGYEPAVLSGAAQTLSRFRPLLYVEFNDVILRDAGSSSAELLDRFSRGGYRPTHDYAPAALGLEGAVVDLLLEPV